MDQRLPLHRARGHVRHAIAQHVPSLGRELQPLPRQIPVPWRIGRSLEHQFQLLLRLPQLVFGMFALALVGKVPQGKVNVRRHGEEQALGLVIKGLSRLCHQDKHRIHRPIAVQRDGHCGGRARQSVDPNRSVFAQCRARRALAGQVLPTHATGGQRHHFSRVSGVPTDPRGLHPSQAHSRLTDVSEEHGLIRTLHDRLIASAQRCIQAFLALDARLGKHPGSDVLHHHHALRTFTLVRRRQPPDLQVDPGAGSITPFDAAIHRIRTLAPLDDPRKAAQVPQPVCLGHQ